MKQQVDWNFRLSGVILARLYLADDRLPKWEHWPSPHGCIGRRWTPSCGSSFVADAGLLVARWGWNPLLASCASWTECLVHLVSVASPCWRQSQIFRCGMCRSCLCRRGTPAQWMMNSDVEAKKSKGVLYKSQLL